MVRQGGGAGLSTNRLFTLKTPNSGAQGWLLIKTATSGLPRSLGYVGKLNPRTGEIVEYRPADATEIDPHTPVFGHNGILCSPMRRPTISGDIGSTLET
jgi:hypothetical protein